MCFTKGFLVLIETSFWIFLNMIAQFIDLFCFIVELKLYRQVQSTKSINENVQNIEKSCIWLCWFLWWIVYAFGLRRISLPKHSDFFFKFCLSSSLFLVLHEINFVKIRLNCFPRMHNWTCLKISVCTFCFNDFQTIIKKVFWTFSFFSIFVTILLICSDNFIVDSNIFPMLVIRFDWWLRLFI